MADRHSRQPFRGAISHPQRARVTAVLGPTNTGKTHFAIERMLAHRSGMIGLPLRLLAREVYDKIVRLKGAADPSRTFMVPIRVWAETDYGVVVALASQVKLDGQPLTRAN